MTTAQKSQPKRAAAKKSAAAKPAAAKAQKTETPKPPAKPKFERIKLETVEWGLDESSENADDAHAIVDGYEVFVNVKKVEKKKDRFTFVVFTKPEHGHELYSNGEQASLHGAKNRAIEIVNKARRAERKGA